MTKRLFPPVSGSTSITVNGRTYSAAVGSTIDVPNHDAIIMTANGWTAAAGGGDVGTTAQRPTTPTHGLQYLDTTLGKTIIFEGANWRDATTGAVV